MQLPGRLHGSDDVVAALDYGCRDVPDALHVVKEIAVAREPPSMDKVVAGWKEIIRLKKRAEQLPKKRICRKERKEEKKESQTSSLHAVR